MTFLEWTLKPSSSRIDVSITFIWNSQSATVTYLSVHLCSMFFGSFIQYHKAYMALSFQLNSPNNKFSLQTVNKAIFSCLFLKRVFFYEVQNNQISINDHIWSYLSGKIVTQNLFNFISLNSSGFRYSTLKQVCINIKLNLMTLYSFKYSGWIRSCLWSHWYVNKQGVCPKSRAKG